MREHNLDCHSLPYEWLEAFLPRSLTSLWTSYTHTKALMANAGHEGEIYPDFKPFSPIELRKHIGVYFVHGLAPSPSISMNFKPHSENNVNGNDFFIDVLDLVQPDGINTSSAFLLFKIL